MVPLRVVPGVAGARVAVMCLVASLLLQDVVGEECVHGFPSSDTVNMYGPGSRSNELPSTLSSRLYVFPSLNFSCNGTITDIRMRMDFIALQSGPRQIVWVYFLLFREELTTPTRSVTQILLNSSNTEQYFDGPKLTEIWQTLNLSLLVTEGDFIGFAVPANSSMLFNKNINLSPTSERVEAHVHQLSETFGEFVVQLPEVARTADSSQFTTQMIAPPLIDVTFSPGSSTGLTPSPTAQPSGSSVSSIPPTATSTTPPTETIPTSTSTTPPTETILTSTSTTPPTENIPTSSSTTPPTKTIPTSTSATPRTETMPTSTSTTPPTETIPTSTSTTPPTETIPTSSSTTPPTETIPTSTSPPTRPQSTSTPGSPPSQLMIIVIAVVATTVLLLVVVVVLVVVMVMVACKKIKDEYDPENEQKGSKMDCKPVTASFAMTNTVTSDATIGGVTSDSPKDSEEAGLHDSLHSPTTGQMKSATGVDSVTYALPTLDTKQNTSGSEAAGHDNITYALPTLDVKHDTSGSKTAPAYAHPSAHRASHLFVPTIDERAKYASPEELSIQYELPITNPEGSQHYEFPSTESEHYWCPANNEADLYRQLSQHKYQEIPRSSVIQDEQIGEGEFGVVCQGEWQNVSGVVQQVAIKMLHSEDNKVKFLQEAAAMGQFNHPHVARLFGVVTVGKPVMIVMELLEKGDLRSYLLTVDPSQHPSLPPLLLKFSRQVADGMAHLSSKDFIHRDLAARNILLDRQLNCKIADFGMSRDLTNEYYFSQGGRIPLKWTAPEALLYHKYSTGSDVWSYGMVLFEIWSLGHKPFEEKTSEQLVEIFSSRNGYCQAPPPGCPREVYTVMVECWNPDHHNRPRFNEVYDSLSRPELIPTSFGENLDLKSVPPSAFVLGSPLDAAKSLYLDLQLTYRKNTHE